MERKKKKMVQGPGVRKNLSVTAMKNIYMII